MLRQILQELQSSQGPINLQDLSRRLGVERSALEGMMAFLVRKGRLRDGMIPGTCVGEDCTFCPGEKSCSMITRLPNAFSLASHSSDEKNPD